MRETTLMMLCRAHPTWSMFAACDPEKPCITPGTYAFLGAAAGLAYARLFLFYAFSLMQISQRDNADHRDGCGHYVRADRRLDLHPSDDGTAFCSSSRFATDESSQIVVMVTKAVSDQFGKGGIADQMIRYNGFPFLENEDHAFNISGALTPGTVPEYEADIPPPQFLP